MSFVLSSYAIKTLCKIFKANKRTKNMKLYKQILPQTGSELDTWNSILHVNFAVNFTRSKKKMFIQISRVKWGTGFTPRGN